MATPTTFWEDVTEPVILFPEAIINDIAERAAALVMERTVPAWSSPYLTVPEAAEYARCSRQRIYDLLSSARLTRHKDGSRVLVGRDELDAYLQ